MRPGRIDRCVHCPLPASSEERFEILTAISRKLSLNPDVDLHLLAGATEHFSGADLKSVLVDAHLEAVEEGSSAKENISMSSDETISLSFRKTLTDDPSSLSAPETRRLMNEIRTVARLHEELDDAGGAAVSKIVTAIRNEQISKALLGKMPSVSAVERHRFQKL